MHRRPVLAVTVVLMAVALLLPLSGGPGSPVPTHAQGPNAFQLVLPLVANDADSGSVSSGKLETRNVSSYTDASNPDAPVFFVVGELVNGRPNAVERIELTAKFFTAQGQQIDVDGNVTYADLEVIPAGGDSPFSFAIVAPPALIASFTIAVTGVTDPAVLPAISGVAADITNTRTEGAFRFVTGTVRNDSSFTWLNVTVLVAYYDAAGRVVRTDLTFPANETLGPGQQTTFESFVNVEGTSIVTQRIWVRASR